jgi:hypothetical protein
VGQGHEDGKIVRAWRRRRTMKRKILVLVIFVLAASQAPAELLGRTFVAEANSQTFTINASQLTIANDGANEIYVRVFLDGETPAAAVAGTSPEIKSGEDIELGRIGNIQAISIVCAASETATVRLFYW